MSGCGPPELPVDLAPGKSLGPIVPAASRTPLQNHFSVLECAGQAEA